MDRSKKKKILITGANGLLGQALVKELASPFAVLATARKSKLALKTSEVSYQSLDINFWGQCRDIIGKFNPDVIVNATFSRTAQASWRVAGLAWVRIWIRPWVGWLIFMDA